MSDEEYGLYHPLVLAIAEGAVATVLGWQSPQGQNKPVGLKPWLGSL